MGFLGLVLDLEFVGAQSLVDPLNMLAAGGFQNQLDFGLADGHLAEAAALADLQHIRAEIGDPLRDPRQAAGTVRNHDRESPQAAVLDEARFDDARNQIHVDIAAAEDQADVLAGEADFLIQQCRQGYGGGAFGDGFFDFEQDQDRLGDFAFAHSDDLVDIFFRRIERSGADPAHGDAVGDGRGRRQLGRRALFQGDFHRRDRFRLDADDSDPGLEGFERQRYASDRTAAAHRHDHRIEIGILLVNLKADGSLAGDDPGVVEGRNERERFFPAQPDGLGVGRVVIAAVEHAPGAVLAHAGDFNQRRKLGHDDGRGDVQAPAVKRDRHAVIARAGGDHAAPGFFRRQRQQAIERAALFERAGHLQIFQLEKNFAAGHLADGFRARERGDINLLLDALPRLFDVGEGDHYNEGRMKGWGHARSFAQSFDLLKS